MRLLDLEAKSPLYSHFIESLSGLVTIRAFGWGTNFEEQNLALLDKSQKPYYLLFCIQRWLGLVLDLMVTALAIILMVLVVKLVGFPSCLYMRSTDNLIVEGRNKPRVCWFSFAQCHELQRIARTDYKELDSTRNFPWCYIATYELFKADS
jgi:ABC-type multidrug transport system fused ATPase/permease subunit